MSFLTLANYKTWAGIASVDATRDASLTVVLDEIEDALKRMLGQPIESATYTEYIDAPPGNTIALRWKPVTAVSSVKYAPNSGGDPSLFTSDTALTQYTQWILDVDQPDGTTSKSGVIRVMDRSAWGARRERPVDRLGYRLVPDPRAIQVVYTAGYATVPSAILGAGYLATSKLYLSRKHGAQVTSASLNGGSYSLPGPATAEGALLDPTIQGMLKTFLPYYVG